MTLQDIQTLMAAIGGLGGLTGVGAVVGLFFQKRKIRAEAADVLTDTAITLVEPLKQRVKEVVDEAREAREETRKARLEVAEIREAFSDVVTVMRRWRTAILNPSVPCEDLVLMVHADRGADDVPPH